MWKESTLFPSSLWVFSLSTKQGLLILKRTSSARSQKSKSWCVNCNLISNKTSNKSSCTIKKNTKLLILKLGGLIMTKLEALSALREVEKFILISDTPDNESIREELRRLYDELYAKIQLIKV